MVDAESFVDDACAVFCIQQCFQDDSRAFCVVFIDRHHSMAFFCIGDISSYVLDRGKSKSCDKDIYSQRNINAKYGIIRIYQLTSGIFSIDPASRYFWSNPLIDHNHISFSEYPVFPDSLWHFARPGIIICVLYGMFLSR